MSYKKQTTHKLYYRKWSYKIKCYCKGSYMVKRMGIPYTINECWKKQAGRTLLSRDFDPDKLLAFIQDVEVFLDKDIHIRTEGSIFSIYCNDTQLFDKMCKQLSFWIHETFEPANDLEYQFMLDNGHKKVICNHLPFQKYQYRVFLKEKMPLEFRERFWTWMSKYNGKLHSPLRVGFWLMGKKQWVTNPNIYVQDGPTLSMSLLFLGDKVSKVEEFVPRSMINTLSEEQPCQV